MFYFRYLVAALLAVPFLASCATERLPGNSKSGYGYYPVCHHAPTHTKERRHEGCPEGTILDKIAVLPHRHTGEIITIIDGSFEYNFTMRELVRIANVFDHVAVDPNGKGLNLFQKDFEPRRQSVSWWKLRYVVLPHINEIERVAREHGRHHTHTKRRKFRNHQEVMDHGFAQHGDECTRVQPRHQIPGPGGWRRGNSTYLHDPDVPCFDLGFGLINPNAIIDVKPRVHTPKVDRRVISGKFDFWF